MVLIHPDDLSLNSQPLSPTAPLWFGFVMMLLSWILWNAIRFAYKPSKAASIICIISVMAVTTLTYLIQLTLPHPRPLVQMINTLVTAPLSTMALVVYSESVLADGYAAVSTTALIVTTQLAAANVREGHSRLSFDIATALFFIAFAYSLHRVTNFMSADSALTHAVLYRALPSILIAYVGTTVALAIFYEVEIVSLSTFIALAALIDVTFKLIFSALLTAQIISHDSTTAFVAMATETYNVYDEPTVFYGQSPDEARYQTYRQSKLSSYQTDVVDERIDKITRQCDEDEEQIFEPL